MKICVIGENPNLPSGFGMQIGMLCRGLRDLGHEIVCLANNGPSFQEEDFEVQHIKELHNAALIDRELALIRPEAVIVFYHTQQCKEMRNLKYAARNCPVFWWLPWEGTLLPADRPLFFANGVPKNRVVHLSTFARNLWSELAPSDVVIPHMYDPEIWKPPAEDVRARLRRKWTKKLRLPYDVKLILNLDRNIWHKRWDSTFDFIRRLDKKMPGEVHLIAHTVRHQRGPQGQHGYDLNQIANLYGVTEMVTFSDFDWIRGLPHADLAELMSIVDLRISTSQGEGFGVPTIECGALGTPQLVTDSTTMPELFGNDESFMMVPPAFTEERLGTLWKVPDIGEYVRRAEGILKDAAFADLRTELGDVRQHVEANFTQNSVCKQWDDLITGEVTSHSSYPSKYFYDSRWGYSSTRGYLESISSLAETLPRFKDDRDPTVFEIGAHRGMFMAACSPHGLRATGWERDPKCFEKPEPLSRGRLVQVKDYLQDWPEADILVMNGSLDFLPEEPADDTLARLAKYGWVFWWDEPCGIWGYKPNITPIHFEELLTQDHVRRFDIEEIIKANFNKGLLHQVWQRGNDTSELPQGLMLRNE